MNPFAWGFVWGMAAGSIGVMAGIFIALWFDTKDGGE